MCLDDEALKPDEAPWKDPIVEEVRDAGRQLWTEAGGTLEGFFAFLRRAQAQHPERVVHRVERVPGPTAA